MRKLCCSALMIACLMLSACGGTEQQVRTFNEVLCGAASVRTAVQVTADCGDTVECFTLEYMYDGSEWTALVTAPAVLSGIAVHIGEAGTELEFDGVMLAAGDVLSSGVTAIGSVPLIWDALRTGSLDCVWTEGALLGCTLRYDDAISVSLWYNAEGLPAAAEVTENGIGKISCRFSNTKIEVGTHGSTKDTDLGGDQPEQSGT